MTIVDRIKEKGQLSNMTIASIERAAGISNGTLAKRNESSPTVDKLSKVANILNVSLEYLISGKNKESMLSHSEEEWLSLFHQMSERDRIECIRFIKGYLAGTRL